MSQPEKNKIIEEIRNKMLGAEVFEMAYAMPIGGKQLANVLKTFNKSLTELETFVQKL